MIYTSEEIETIYQSIAEGKPFDLEYASDVIKQVIIFEEVSSLFFIALSLFGLTVSGGAVRTWFDKARSIYDINPLELAGVFILVAASLVTLVVKTYAFLKVTFAPKLFLIEYASEMIK